MEFTSLRSRAENTGTIANSGSSSLSNGGPSKGHSRNASIAGLMTSRTCREETLDHEIYLLADQKGTFASEDKLTRLRNCIQYIYGANVVVKLLARPSHKKKKPKVIKIGEETNSMSRGRPMMPTTVDEIIAIEREGTVSTSKILYYA